MNSTPPEDSPYASPLAPCSPASDAPLRIIDTLVFVVNFLVASLLFASCVVSIGSGDDPYDFLAALALVLPVAGYAIAEWCCWYCRRERLYAPLGGLNLAVCLFLLFGLVTGLGEVLTAKDPVDPQSLVYFTLICGPTAGYLGVTGWRRLIRGVAAEESHRANVEGR